MPASRSTLRRRPGGHNFFDNGLVLEERSAADELIDLAERHIVSIVPHTVRTELDHPNTPASTTRRAAWLPHTLDTGMGNRERSQLVQNAVQGNALPGTNVADAAHLYDAALWQCAYFVTCDKRLLRRDVVIAEVIDDLWLVTPSELLAIYRQ